MSNYFYYNGNVYLKGTIIKIKENYKHIFGCCTYLKFIEYDTIKDLYYFVSINNVWEQYSMSKQQIEQCIEQFVTCNNTLLVENGSKIDESYIDGIMSAWIWYVLILLFGLFIKGVENKIIVWITASLIFFTWKNKKINGGKI